MGRLAKPQKRNCNICGAEFDAFAHNAMFCPACRREHYLSYHRNLVARQRKRERDKLGKLNTDCTSTVSEKVIRRAKKKPAGVSDVRWRIELRRRKCPEYYSQFGAKA